MLYLIMKSKERVLRAINHEEPDRVPCDFWGLEDTKARLRAHFGVEDDEGFLEALGIDIRSVWPAYIGPEKKTYPDGSLEDFWGIRRKKIGGFDTVILNPLREASSIEEVEAYPWPDPDWFDYKGFREKCEKLSDYALVSRDTGPNTTCVLRVAMFLRGMDKFLMDLVLNPDLARAIISKVEGFYFEHDRRMFEEAGDLLDIYMIADDLGTQSGLLISPAMWREFVAPSIRKFIVQAKKYGMRIMLHSCGAIRPLIPDFIEMGVEILNPIQTTAKGMVPRELKEKFGEELCFHGSIDTQHTLPFGTPEEVAAEVRDRIKTLGPGGGFILAPSQTLGPDVPLENIIAMYETAHEAGIYQ
jgi:uroporphyrinogen decarboxylase